jgi:hypothetical protein
MLVPLVLARVEEIYPIARNGIETGKIAAFVQVALRATPGEIFRVVTPAVDASNDVIDVERPLVGGIGQAAVFAAAARAKLNGLSRTCIHR